MKHIPKSKLIAGQKYKGHCRNTDEATWNGEVFVYEHTEWHGNTYTETIHCPEDDDVYDVFYAQEPLP